jgi:hypothetical protein
MPSLSNSPSLRAKGYVIKTERYYPLSSYQRDGEAACITL